MRPFPENAAIGTELVDQESAITEAFEIWDAAFTCSHVVAGVNDEGDVALDTGMDAAGRYSHLEGRIYLGPGAIKREAVVTTVLHELGHAHLARHVDAEGSLMAAEVVPGNITIDAAMEASVCAGDSSCCD